MIEFARGLIAAQTHRRMIEPRFMAPRVTPFCIERPVLNAASGPMDLASGATVAGADKPQGNSL